MSMYWGDGPEYRARAGERKAAPTMDVQRWVDEALAAIEREHEATRRALRAERIANWQRTTERASAGAPGPSPAPGVETRRDASAPGPATVVPTIRRGSPSGSSPAPGRPDWRTLAVIGGVIGVGAGCWALAIILAARGIRLWV